MARIIRFVMKEHEVLSPNCKGIILVIDGDNTLWDTNSVFEVGQHWILKSVNTERPEGLKTLSFKMLRRVDDLLIVCADRQEYEFQLLVCALILVRMGMTETEAVSAAMTELREHPQSMNSKLALKISRQFRCKLQEIPPLLPFVSTGLEKLLRLRTHHKGRLALILLSEGDKQRIRAIVKHHFGEKTIFDVVHIVRRKSKNELLHAQYQGLQIITNESAYEKIQTHLIVVGDSIASDIVPGNLIGATTIYIAGGYRGVEIPINKSERPQMVFKNFGQVPEFIKSILMNPNDIDMLSTRE